MRDPQEQISIHPGVQNGRRVFAPAHTSKPPKDASKGKLGKKAANLARRRLAHASTLKGLPTGENPMQYKTPGSMKRGK